ncbi:MAG: multidrug efflux RND transporter permease subunit [Phycisphaerae bacterium]|jgi:HAE1 family hydrophobic/amphiphilic exporter-1|nr:multidrug efflux RND transporter permease subunit [Phycisphaerae bacterium]
MSRFFIDRPIFASVISIVIVLLGAIAYLVLPTEQYPNLAPPVVRVEATYPGASAATIADTVASPLEQEVNGVDRMIYMSSTATDSRYALDVSFQPGVDIDMASVLVQNRVNIATAKLPAEVRQQGITVKKQSSSLVGVISVSVPDPAKHPELDDLALSNFLTIFWKDEFARIYGVGGLQIMPAKDYSMRVWFDPAKLKARELTVGDVVNAIQAQNVQVAAGSLGRQPAPAGTAFEYVVTTKGRLTEPTEFAGIIVKSLPGGGVVRVGDVATVERGARDYGTLAGFNGTPGAILVIYQLPGANLVDVSDSVRAKLAELSKGLPVGTESKLFYDASMFIKASLTEVQHTLIEAFVLVFLVVLLFLRNLRATFIPVITIPVSLIGTFLIMAALGFSVNMLTMFGIVLAIGIVVDDAIVVVENVERVMSEEHLSAREATIKAMREITGPVIAITLVLMSVFIPAAAQPGLTGTMYRQFALTIAASTGLSAICALTLSPALCALLLRHVPADAKDQPKGFILFRPFVWLSLAFERLFGALTSVYAAISNLLCRAWPVTLLLFAGTVFLVGWIYVRVPSGFVPAEDLGFVAVSATLPDGASVERSDAVIRRVAAAVQKVDGVADVAALTGFSMLDGNGPNYANAWVILDPWEERYANGRSINAIIADVNAIVAPIQEARFLVFGLPPISGLGNTAGLDMRIQDRATAGRESLGRGVEQLAVTAGGQPGVVAAFSSYRPGVSQIFLDIDREKAIRLGIPLQTLFQTLQASLGAAYVNDFNEFGRTFQVNVQADAAFRQTTDDIGRLEVRTAAGRMVPLSTLVTASDTIAPNKVERYNLYQAATMTTLLRPGTSSGEGMRTLERAAEESLPQGMGYEWTGMSYQERLVGNAGLIVFALAILLVYLILAAQYESWMVPIAVVLSIPLVVLGAMLALMVRGLDNNIFTQIGLVLLVGLGAKNAILIVEFARENRAHGKSIRESAVAAARTRFRPIIMTSLAFILGVVPLLRATGAGAGSRQALGTAVFGGMIGVTILGLLFTPALYCVVQWIDEAIFRRVPRKAGAATPEPAAAA